MRTALLFIVWSTLGVAAAIAEDAAQNRAAEATAAEPVLTTSSIRPGAARKPQKARDRRYVASVGYGQGRHIPTIVGIGY